MTVFADWIMFQGARWDYHSTHINLLLTLYTVETNYTIFKQTAERLVRSNTPISSVITFCFRWRSYMVGQRSSHN